MRVLLTGVAGFIGSNLAYGLLNQGHEVVGVDCFLPNLYSAELKIEQFNSLLKKDKFFGHERDLRFDPIGDLMDDIDVVINEAALPGLLPSWKQTDNYLTCNVLVVQKILDEVVKRPGTKFIQASTSSVYGEEAIGAEGKALNPYSPYGVTKLAAENLIRAYDKNFELSYTILRYFSVYGRNQRPDMAYSIICNRLLRNETIYVTGDGMQTRSNTHIHDVVNATMLATHAKGLNQAVNVSGNQSISLLDAIQILSDQLKKTPNIQFVEKSPGDQKNTFGDSALAKKLLGWEPETSLIEGLKEQADMAQHKYQLSL